MTLKIIITLLVTTFFQYSQAETDYKPQFDSDDPELWEFVESIEGKYEIVDYYGNPSEYYKYFEIDLSKDDLHGTHNHLTLKALQVDGKYWVMPSYGFNSRSSDAFINHFAKGSSYLTLHERSGRKYLSAYVILEHQIVETDNSYCRAYGEIASKVIGYRFNINLEGGRKPFVELNSSQKCYKADSKPFFKDVRDFPRTDRDVPRQFYLGKKID